MSREIKFRIYDKVLGYMILPETQLSLMLHNGQVMDGGNKIEDVILMQYTGLKDKNGVEIYCGDIIISRNDPSVVVWSEDRACYLYENPRWSKNQHGWHLDCDVACEVEVIGNIHQNPELLK